MADDSAGPVCVALVNDYEVVVKGLRDMLADFSERVQVVEIDLGVEVDQHVDVALYDCFSALPLSSDDLDALVAQPEIGAVAVYTWSSRDDLVRTALGKGARGYLSKAMDATALVAALERLAAGEQVVVREEGARSAGDGPAGDEQILGDWPGRAEGLTARQAEIVCLITQGLSNSEICERTYLTLNTVKSYIRDAYRTMGVTHACPGGALGRRARPHPDAGAAQARRMSRSPRGLAGPGPHPRAGVTVGAAHP